MVVLGGGAISYERSTPVVFWPARVSTGNILTISQKRKDLALFPCFTHRYAPPSMVQEYLAHKKPPPPRTLQ